MSVSGLVVTLVTSALAVLICMVTLWRESVRLRDVSIVDIFWGPGCALVALFAFVVGRGPFDRRLLLFALVAVWGLRLGAYIGWRNLGKGEDARYTALRRRIAEDQFDRWSLRHVFLFQGLMMWLVAMALQVSANVRTAAIFLPGVAVWALGIAFEAVGDLQLARFKADPANAGKVMDRGLWRYTRHPNYFGDACVWWGIWLVTAVHWSAAATVFAPVLMTFILLRVTGKRVLEHRLTRTRPEYAAYVARTSGFLPRPPRSAT